MKKCMIIGAGACDTAILRQRLRRDEDDLIIAADGGLDHLLAIGTDPDIVLGDMDSVKDKGSLNHFHVKRLPAEKDDTDMLAAIREGLALGFEDFELYGALGGRIDHTIANLQCLLFLLDNGAKGRIMGDDAMIMLIKNERISFAAGGYPKGRKISVFAFSKDAYGVSETGLKYALEDATIRQGFPIGVSNEFMGTDAEIAVKDGVLLICINMG